MRIEINSIYLVCTTLLILALQLAQPWLYKQSFSDSPSFVRQEINDPKGDWQLWKGSFHSFNVTTHYGESTTLDMANNISDCQVNGHFISPDIESISYSSDGKTLDGTIWLTAPFVEPPLNDSLDTYQEELKIEVQNQNLSLEDYTEVRKGEIGISDLNIENLSLAGLPAHKVIYEETEGNENLERHEFWTVHNDKVYDLSFLVLKSNYKKYYPVFQKMINSFKLKEPESNISTINQSTQEMKIYYDSDIMIDYPSNWQTMKTQDNYSSSVILRSPFEDSLTNTPSWHETVFTMSLDLNSVYDAGTDYRIIYSRIPYGEWTGNWTRQVEEVSAYDKIGFLEEKNNITLFDKRAAYRIPFKFDLESAKSPEQYKLVFYVTDHYILGHHFCRLVDTTNWAIVPPPKFVVSTSPSSVGLRPGEQKEVAVEIKGITNLESEASLMIDNTRKDVSAIFIPNRISIPSSSSGTSTLHIKILGNSTVSTEKPVFIPIKANITFPTTITNRGGDTFSNNKSISLPVSSNFTLTIIPPYSDFERFNNVVNTVITPISGIWTFLAGVGAVVVPLILQLYRKRQKNKTKIGTSDKGDKDDKPNS